MKRIAIVLMITDNEKYGAFNATIERILHFQAHCDYHINVFAIQTYNGWLARLLRKRTKYDIPSEETVQGVLIHNIPRKLSIIDHVLEIKLHLKPIIKFFEIKRFAKRLKDYDLISANSTYCAQLAYYTRSKYHVPYTVTWHGSDIHSEPFVNHSLFKTMIKLIRAAEMNFFVSKDLMQISDRIIPEGNKMVLYNGVDKKKFHAVGPDERLKIRTRLNMDNHLLHIAFVGLLTEIKNTLILPSVYKIIHEKMPNTCFHIVGDGKLKLTLLPLFDAISLPYVFHGNVSSDKIPDIYRAMDLIVLPSLNEGMPLTALESLASGTRIVGTRVGGIPEVIGIENTVPLDKDTITNLAQLCIKQLNNERPVSLDSVFDWDITGEKEAEVYRTILFEPTKNIYRP